MEKEIKKSVWDIRVLQEETLRVCFVEKLTKEQALDAMLDDDFAENIIEERDPSIIEIVDAE